MVINDMRLLPQIIAIFEEYAGFSNLGLNLKKRWSIPLTHEGHNIDSVKLEVLQDIQSSTIREKISTMHFTKTAKYLGVMIHLT